MPNPREPKHVKKLIADAQARQVESAVVRYTKALAAKIAGIDKKGRGGGGTRRGGR